jgi:transcriptional regulator with XRE-family HTH domain
MSNQRIKLSDQIRRAVDASGLSRYRIAKKIGVAESTMSRFMAGSGLETSNLDRLADLLGVDIVVSKTPKVQKGRSHGQHQ